MISLLSAALVAVPSPEVPQDNVSLEIISRGRVSQEGPGPASTPPAAPPAAPPGLAALHPADALIFLEVPDLPAVRQAYRRSAFGRLLRDEELQATLGRVLGRETVEPLELLRARTLQAVEQGDLPPIVGILAELGELRRVSLSWTARGGLFQVGAAGEMGLEPEAPEAPKAPRTLEAPDLSETPETPETPEASEVPGALDPPETFGILLAAEFSGPEAAGAVLERLVAELGGRMEFPGSPDEPQVATFEPPRDPGSPGPRPLGPLRALVRSGARIVLLLGDADLEALLARLGGGGESLDGSPALTLGAEHFRGRGLVVVEGFSRFDEVLARMPGMDRLGSVIDILEGLAGVTVAMVYRGGHWRVVITEQGRFVTEGFHRPNPEAILATHPLDRSALGLVHPDAVVAWVAHLDREPLLAILSEGLAGLATDPLAEIEAAYGFRPDRDLLAPLGPALAYSLPAPRSLLAAPPLTFAAALGDREAFDRGMEGVARWIEAEAGGALSVQVSEYRSVSLCTFEFDLGQATPMMPIDPGAFLKPTVAVLDDRVIVTTLPSHARKEIRRVGRQERVLPGLLAGSELPADVAEVGFADWTQFLGKVYSGLKLMVPMLAAGGPDLPFDPSELPDAELVTRHFAPSLRWKRNVEGGVVQFQESSFGPEAPLLLGASLGYMALASWSAPATPPGPGGAGRR